MNAIQIVIEMIQKYGEDCIRVDLRKELIQSIGLYGEVKFEDGKQQVVDILFPEIIDDYHSDSPLRDAALKLVEADKKWRISK